MQDKSGRADYNCFLRVYVVEPVSRWKDNTNFYHFDFGFLGFAHDTTLSLAYQETYQETKTFDSLTSGYGFTEDNIMAIAVLFNADDYHTAYSDPPSGSSFTAYHVDAAAAATPGVPGYDTAYGVYTHTVFIDEATRTGCPNCPYTRQALKNAYESGNHNFYYAAMVRDSNVVASDYLYDYYNLAWVPTCYFDGGVQILVGGYIDTSYYTSRIMACGQRAVPDLDLDISMTWMKNSSVEITVTVTNNEFTNSAPQMPAAPGGPSAGLLEDEHQFTATTIDPDDDQLWYKWDWDNAVGDWEGPYSSGEVVNKPHTWSSVSAPDTFAVRVKVKDEYVETDWSQALNVFITERGDANGDGAVDVGDVVFMIAYVFKGGPAPYPESAGDANCDGLPDVGDAVYLIAYIFKGGPPPGCP
jgi:hypothetical protein